MDDRQDKSCRLGRRTRSHQFQLQSYMYLKVQNHGIPYSDLLFKHLLISHTVSWRAELIGEQRGGLSVSHQTKSRETKV